MVIRLVSMSLPASPHPFPNLDAYLMYNRYIKVNCIRWDSIIVYHIKIFLVELDCIRGDYIKLDWIVFWYIKLAWKISWYARLDCFHTISKGIMPQSIVSKCFLLDLCALDQIDFALYSTMLCPSILWLFIIWTESIAIVN